MRLIDADALLRYIDAGHLRNRHEICFSEFDVATMVDQQLTIEAVPVVRGEWVYSAYYGFSGREYGRYNCSECGCLSRGDGQENFCSNCGADMRGN